MCISTRARKLRTVTGWRALALCYGAGALLTFGFAPFHVWPVLFLALPVLYLLLDGAATPRQAAWRGFFFGYGYFMAGTWWIANAMLVDAAKFAWMMPFSILGLSAALAIYFALFGVLVHWTRTPQLLANILRVAALWTLVEYLRSAGAFGFAWNLVGYMALASTPAAQLASVTGTFGLGFLLVLAGLLPVVLVLGQGARQQWASIATAIGILLALQGYGMLRLPPAVASTDTIVRIVQPSIPQQIKHTLQGQMQAMGILLSLSAEKAAMAPAVTVWPETAYPKTLRALQTGLQWPYSPLLITGAVALEEDADGLRIYNSIAAIDPMSTVLARYNKHQLVPFGEFVPLRSVLPLEKITPGDIDFSRGTGPQTIVLDGVPPFSPLVCYEVVFPWMAVDHKNRPSWMVNATNDGWYGHSPGPYQHFDMARMRAIEQGLPLVRAANNGISAMIDPYGRVVAAMLLDERGLRDVALPQSLANTVYAKWGEWLTLVLMVLVWALSGRLGRMPMKSQNH